MYNTGNLDSQRGKDKVPKVSQALAKLFKIFYSTPVNIGVFARTDWQSKFGGVQVKGVTTDVNIQRHLN